MTLRVAIRIVLPLFLLISFTLSCRGYLTGQQSQSPRASLLAAMKAKLGAKSYRVKEVQSAGGEGVGLDSVTTGEYVAPDKYHAMLEGSVLGNSVKAETLLIGEAAYVRTREGKWERRQIDPQRVKQEFAKLRHDMLIENLSKAKDSDVKFSGEAEVDGSSMLIYQFSFAGPPEAPGVGQVTVWVTARDGLPHKIEVAMLAEPKGLEVSFKTTTTFYDYNADIKIDSPI